MKRVEVRQLLGAASRAGDIEVPTLACLSAAGRWLIASGITEFKLHALAANVLVEVEGECAVFAASSSPIAVARWRARGVLAADVEPRFLRVSVFPPPAGGWGVAAVVERVAKSSLTSSVLPPAEDVVQARNLWAAANGLPRRVVADAVDRGLVRFEPALDGGFVVAATDAGRAVAAAAEVTEGQA
jgi:hypothetical protein